MYRINYLNKSNNELTLDCYDFRVESGRIYFNTCSGRTEDYVEFVGDVGFEEIAKHYFEEILITNSNSGKTKFFSFRFSEGKEFNLNLIDGDYLDLVTKKLRLLADEMEKENG